MKHSRFGPLFHISLLLAVVLSPFLLSPPLDAAPNDIQVTSSSDSGPGTLRQALLSASVGETITFSPTAFPPGSPVTIYVRSALPTLDRNRITIDASNTGVVLDGARAPAGTNGLTIEANNCVVRGLTIQRFPKDGIWIETGASGNTIGGNRNAGSGPNGRGNLIILNGATGVSVRGDTNQVLGNYIGVDGSGQTDQGNAYNGVALWDGATGNVVGGALSGYRNVLSGNDHSGMWIVGTSTSQNEVIGNYIGTNADGDAGVGNTLEGIAIDAAYNNVVEGNVLSGNGSNGILVINGGHHNVIRGNFIGTDSTGTFAIGGQPGGGVDLASGAQYNTVGGPTAAERNVISGNGIDGIFIQGTSTRYNIVQNNYIGIDVSGTKAIPNSPWGIWFLGGGPNNTIVDNRIEHNTSHGLEISNSASDSDFTGNTVSHNGGSGFHFDSSTSQHLVANNTVTDNGQAGVLVEGSGCAQITIQINAIYSNTGPGIDIESSCIAAPQLTDVAIGSTEIVTGTTAPNARVEVFSDDEDEGRTYEGYTTADGAGNFSFSKVGGFTRPNVTATSTDASGNTSEFSRPMHLSWTFLLYLSGDNDLEDYMINTLTNTVAAGPSPRANVLMLVDGYTTTSAYSATVLYDVTWGAATSLGVSWNITNELNMGDGQTLQDFVTWGRAYYPARYTMLAIVDHGGGWAPGDAAYPFDESSLAHSRRYFAGTSGLSWDYSSGYDYLDSREISRTLAAITDNGSDPLDVVFYDVCLMGMAEVAYQIKDYASYFVSSQNIGWAPVGPQGRYVQTIQGLDPATTPQQMAEFLVETYADATPPNEHPFTISAVDLSTLSSVAGATSQLATAISQTLTGPSQTTLLHTVYSETQKLDYDSDFYIEPATDGFVDLYDFALRAAQHYTDSNVDAAAQAVITELDTVIVAEQHRSGRPWLALDRVWDLDDVHGLSIFLPLGEDLELPILITETSPITPSLVITRNLRMRETYSDDQLRFVEDSAWRALIDTYYDVVSSPVPTNTTEGPVDGLLEPDVTPPHTTITTTETFEVGEAITVTWVTTDTQTGVDGAALWLRRTGGEGTPVLTQTGLSGVFVYTPILHDACTTSFAVRAVDKGGNVEPFDGGSNVVTANVDHCVRLPLVCRSGIQ